MQYRQAIRSAVVAELGADGVAIVTLAGRLDAAGAAAAEPRLAALAGAGALVADLAAVTAADAAGLRVLLRVAKRAEAEGGRFALRGLSGAVAALFEASGFAAAIATEPRALHARAA